MAALRYLLFAVLLHWAMQPGHGAATEVTGVVGKSVTFRLVSPAGRHVAWSVRSELIATVTLGNPPEVIFFDQNYVSRLSFPDNGTAVTISRLVMEDAGSYTAQLPEKAKLVFDLRVYPELPQPAVTCVWRNCSDTGCDYKLRCAVPAPAANVSYGWSAPGAPLGNASVLLLELLPAEELPVTCTARNPVSSSNVTVQPVGTCAEMPSRGRTAITAMLAVGTVVVVVLLVAGISYCRAKGRRVSSLLNGSAGKAEAGAADLTLYAQVGPPSRPVSPVPPAQCSPAAAAPGAGAGRQPPPSAGLSQRPSDRSAQHPARSSPSAERAAAEETCKTVYSTVQAAARLQTDDEKIRARVPAWPEHGEKSLPAPALHRP
ncbi:SLAM family member 5-like [Rhea pennata]|uniref:SLAM family member 5-like n=1 Tax=Rhea pennata TaxID=8795 RepID=UPI002E272C50